MPPQTYRSQNYLPLDYYPWPNLLNPHVAQLEKDMEHWIDTDYTDLPEIAREKYKRMKLHYCTARMLPTASYQQITPCNRFMLLYVEIDDQLEHASVAEIEQMRDRIIGILRSDKPALEQDNGLDRQTALMRDEYKTFMPDEWLQWFIDNFEHSFTYGIGVEPAFKMSETPPPLVLFMVLREYSVLMYPYLCWADIASGFVMPSHIRKHPVIQRLRTLMVRIVFMQNDFHSLPKELAKGTEVFNLIMVLQKEYNITFDDACTEALRMHNADLAEVMALLALLPDFGVYHDQVVEYLTCMGTMIQGVNTFYLTDTMRYLPGGAGFAWPEANTAK